MKIKFNPLLRATGVIGVTAALATGVTFANLTSNVVALSPNDIALASASLKIGTEDCPEESLSSVSTPGFDVEGFAPGDSESVIFCLDNTGDVPLLISGTVSAADPGALNSSLAAQATTLGVKCGDDPEITGTLATNWSTVFPSALANGETENCTATVTLSPSYTGSGGGTIPEFSINFAGTQPNS